MKLSDTRYESLKTADFNYLWHPFTQHQLWFDADPLIIEQGEGVQLIDVQGRRYLDGVSSLWCNVWGHAEPSITRAIQQQASRISHSTLLGLSHVPIIELSERLIRFMPESLRRVFYAESGTTAVEAALRMSLEWWEREGTDASRKKTKFASLVGGYHGDTLGAVGVGFVEDFHRALKPAVREGWRIRPPHYFRFFERYSPTAALEASIASLEQLFAKEAETIAALIFEPFVQGASGMWIQPTEFVSAIAELCRKHDVLLIADEVATGFGKTGKMFAIEHAEIKPDLLVLGKGLSGGYLPLSAVVASDRIFENFLGSPEEQKTFAFGTTFSGNPLAAAAGVANLTLFTEESVFPKLQRKIEHFTAELARRIAPLSHVDEVRQFGLMVGIELTKTPKTRTPYAAAELAGARIVREARRLGVIIRPLGNVMVLMPALAMSEEELSRLVDVTAEAIEAALGS